MTRYQKFSFLFVLALAFCLSGASDANAYLINLRPQPDPSNTGSNPTSYSISTTTSALSMTFTKTSAGNAGIGGSDVITIAPTSTSMYIYASTTVSGGATCRINAASTANGNNQSFANYAQSSGLSSGTATTTLTLPSNAFGTYLGLVLTIDNGGAGRGCAMDIYSVVVNGNQLLLAPPPSPLPTTPVPMQVFQENFDGASTTAGTALVDTWGQLGWVQGSSGSGAYTVNASSSAPTLPNIISNVGGTKSVGFYVATSTKIQYGGDVYIGPSSDFSVNLFAQGSVGSVFTGTSTLNVSVCTRNSCGLGVPQVTIGSIGNFFQCQTVQGTSTYTGNSWVPFEVFYDGDNGSVQVFLDGQEYGAICNIQPELTGGIVELAPSGLYDNVWLATDGYIYVPPVPTWGLGTTTVYGYSDFYETRFTGVTVTPSGTSSADFNISYYIDAQEIVPNVLERYPELITVRYSVGTSSIVAGQSGTVATSTLISGGYATTTIDVAGLADGTYIANIQFDNYACASRRAGLTLSDGIPVCPFPLAQANVTFLMVSGVPYVSEVSLVDNSPNINDETGEEETTDLMNVFTRFFVEVFTEKHPFAWYNDFLQLVQQASQIEYESEDLEFSIPIFVAVTNSSSTMEFLDFTEAKEAVDDLDYDDDYQPIERGCELFDEALSLFDFCAFARTMSAYTLYTGLFVLLGYMMYRFFMSDNNAT